MSNDKDINAKAFEQAEKELLEKKVKEVKGFILETLEKIEETKKEKERKEEELRVLKLDLEDLRKGNFSKLEERRAKSSVSRRVSVYIPEDRVSSAAYNLVGSIGNWNQSCSTSTSLPTADTTTTWTGSNADWTFHTAGTYKLNDGTVFYF